MVGSNKGYMYCVHVASVTRRDIRVQLLACPGASPESWLSSNRVEWADSIAN